MKSKIIKAVSLVAALACILSFPVKASATAQGTNGTEMDVVQAQQLEIKLGEAWSGVEFQLRTDAGKYPDPIPVGEDGVLRLEIGGSEKYMLTCQSSRVAIPAPGDALSTEETEAYENASADISATENTIDAGGDATSSGETEGTEPEADAETVTIGGIPVTHVVIFVCGLLIAIALLVFLQTHQRNRERVDFEDDEDEV